ncbi:hypothetical protein [Thermovibrio sp.]
MGKFIQGAAFYLFVYFMLGLLNTGIMFFMTRILHFIPVITVALLMFLSVFVLFFAFKKSLEFFVLKGGREPSGLRVILGWAFHFISFVAVATFLELSLASHLSNPKLIRILTVFSNLIVFFLLYFFAVRFVVGVSDEA